MNKYITLLRPSQYIKNLFIFLPLFFAVRISELELLVISFFAFLSFSLSSSGIYILNDYRDIEEDLKHPIKRDRPLASGAISKKNGLILMGILLFVGLITMYYLSLNAAIILSGYMIMNVAYSFWLKHISIIDISIIALGFVLRIIVGAEVTGIPLSMWIVVMTYLLALFLALAKRRDDVLLYMDTGKKMRKVIDGYNLQFIDSAMLIMASVVIVSYILYTTSREVIDRIGSEYLYSTSLFVILGILRYLKITIVDQNSGSPTKIVLKDRFIQFILISWVTLFFWIIYL